MTEWMIYCDGLLEKWMGPDGPVDAVRRLLSEKKEYRNGSCFEMYDTKDYTRDYMAMAVGDNGDWTVTLCIGCVSGPSIEEGEE